MEPDHVFRATVISVLLPALFMAALAGACLTCPVTQNTTSGSDCCTRSDHCKAPARTPVQKNCTARGTDLSTAAQESHHPVVASIVAVWLHPAAPALETSTSEHAYTEPQYSPPDLRLLYSVLNI
jgi:hypothetical protein